MKTRTRILSLLLCLVMLIGLLPTAVLAVENTSSTVRYSVLILDTSGSMEGTPATKQKEAATRFCTSVLAADGTNYVAIVRLNSSSTVGKDFTDNLDELTAYINSLNAFGGTNINQALLVAGNLLDGVTEPNAIKNIILCSDGLPESGSTSYTGPYSSSDSSYYYSYGNAVYSTSGSLKASFSIYTLGFFHSLSGSDLVFGQRLMQDIQNAGYYEVNDPDDLEFTFGEIADDITSPDDETPIIIIPGIMGSRLYDKDNNLVWGDSLSVALSSFNIKKTGENLRIENDLYVKNDTGFVLGGGLFLEPIKEKDSREYGTIDSYKELVNYLCDTYSSEPENSEVNRDIYFYSYDWRQSNSESAKVLAELLSQRGITKATFICHSMGGLVLSNYIDQNGTDSIESAITLGTPYEGAAKLLRAVLTESVLDGIGGFFNHSLYTSGLTYAVKTQLLGVGELTPTADSDAITFKDFEVADDFNRLSVTGNQPMPLSPVHTLSASQFELQARMLTTDLQLNNKIYQWYEALKQTYDKSGRTLAYVKWNVLYNSIITFIPYYYEQCNMSYNEMMNVIYGASNATVILAEQAAVQQGIQTLLSMNNAYFAIGNTKSTITGAELQYDFTASSQNISMVDLSYGLGDGTVPLYSAEMLLNYCPANAAYFNSDHGGLAKDEDVLKWISDILSGGNSSGTSLSSSSAHTVIRIACPVDVTLEFNGELLSNDLDNYCELSSFGRMDLIGDNNEIKMFCIDSDADCTMTIVGADSGTMDYTIRYLDGNYNLIEQYEYMDIPITEDTIITTTVSYGDEPTLYIDTDGDGFLEWNLNLDGPVIELDALVEETPVSGQQQGSVVVLPKPEPDNTGAPIVEPIDWESGSVHLLPPPVVIDVPAPVQPEPAAQTEQPVDEPEQIEQTEPEVETQDLPDECPMDETCPLSGFSDLLPIAWYHDGIHFVLENGMMNGVGSDRFDPNGTTSRGMIVTILYRLENEPEITANDNPFSDVEDGKWYTISGILLQKKPTQKGVYIFNGKKILIK